MNTPQSLVLALCMAAGLSSATGTDAMPASSPGAAASNPAPAGEASALLARIKQDIGEAGCDNSQQCLSVGVGWRACGGPETYLAVSTLAADGARLAQMVTKHREARQRELAVSGEASNCAALPNPGAVCRPRHPDGKRTCQSGSGGQSRLD